MSGFAEKQPDLQPPQPAPPNKQTSESPDQDAEELKLVTVPFEAERYFFKFAVIIMDSILYILVIKPIKLC
jgi:hypothetical protein